jgi:hypothetical protein
VKVERLQASDTTLQQLAVKFAPEVFDRSMLVCAMYRDSVYRMTVDGRGARLVEQRTDAVHFINTDGTVPWQEAPRLTDFWGNDLETEFTTAESFQMLMHQVVGTTLNLPPSATGEDATAAGRAALRRRQVPRPAGLCVVRDRPAVAGQVAVIFPRDKND